MSTQRIHDHQMAALRKGLLDARLTPSMDPFREFFTGRNPPDRPADFLINGAELALSAAAGQDSRAVATA
jgi:hypothetical protein